MPFVFTTILKLKFSFYVTYRNVTLNILCSFIFSFLETIITDVSVTTKFISCFPESYQLRLTLPTNPLEIGLINISQRKINTFFCVILKKDVQILQWSIDILFLIYYFLQIVLNCNKRSHHVFYYPSKC